MDTRKSNNLSSPTVIVSSRFCSPTSQQLIFPDKFKAPGREQTSLRAIGVDGKVIFKTEASFLSEKPQTLLIDAAAGSALVSFQKKIMDSRSIWEVYAGESQESKDLLFTVSWTDATKTELNVFLASNVTKEICDYRIEGSYMNKTCKVYRGNSSDIVAQMSEEHKFAGMHQKKDDAVLSIEPGMDSAFVAALIVVRYGFHVEGRKMVPTGLSDASLRAISFVLNLISTTASLIKIWEFLGE